MKDQYLELIVKFSESPTPIQTDITLVVAGFLVSGFVISKDEFMQIHPLTKTMQDEIDKLRAANPEDVLPDDGERNYIHLREAKYLTPGGSSIPTNQGVACRFKLEDVAGYHLGVLTTAPA